MTLFLDACVIIYWVEAVDPWFSKLERRLDELRREFKGLSIAASVLSRLECRVKPLREADTDLLGRYDRFFSETQARMMGLDENVIELATGIRALTNLKTADALQAACALSLGSDLRFLTNDRRFAKVPKLVSEAI